MPRLQVYAGKWPKVRLAILERDNWTCQIRDAGCNTRANEVDHIIPVLSGGDWYDDTNLRASCHNCNQRRIHHGSRRWQSARTYITLVTGTCAPEYVRTHCQPTDLIVDVSVLERSLGDQQSAHLARNRLIEQLRQGKVTAPRAWVTASDTTERPVIPHHRHIEAGGGGHGTNDDSQATVPPAVAQPIRAW